MYIIKPTIYESLAREAEEQIGGRDYFSGTMELSDDEADYTLQLTAIIRYELEQCPEATYTVIRDIVPVWWELHTTLEEGEVINDFDFNLFKRWICL